MKKTVLLFVLFTLSLSASTQIKPIQKSFSNQKDTVRKTGFMFVPIFGYGQETGFEFGFGGICSFYIDKKNLLNRNSNFLAAASYSTKKNYKFSFKGEAWTKDNKNHFIAEISFKNTPLNFYGVGNNTLKQDEDKLIQQQVKILLEAERSFIAKAYTGVSLGFENDIFTDKEPNEILAAKPFIWGKQGGSVGFIGVSQSYDTRNSNNYTTKGFFAKTTYRYAPFIFGGNNFTGSLFKLDIRQFWYLSEKVTLATQGIYYTIRGVKTPFYLLQQLGNDQIMRGYYLGRYRDENILNAQAELRYRFVNRFAVVTFGGGGKVFNNRNFNLRDLKPNYGIGWRYFFDTSKELSLRLDYGIGEKLPNEKRQSGFYISFAEAF